LPDLRHTSWLSQFEGYPSIFSRSRSAIAFPWRGVCSFFRARRSETERWWGQTRWSAIRFPKMPSMGFRPGSGKAPSFPHDIDEEEKIGILRNIVKEMTRISPSRTWRGRATWERFIIRAFPQKMVFGAKEDVWLAGSQEPS
jgi:hypothetical protein